MGRVYSLKLTDEEIEDLLSGLSFFQREYPGGKRVNPMTMRAMAKLEKKLWKILRSKKIKL